MITYIISVNNVIFYMFSIFLTTYRTLFSLKIHWLSFLTKYIVLVHIHAGFPCVNNEISSFDRLGIYFIKCLWGGFAGFPNVNHLKYLRFLDWIWSGLKESQVGSGLSVSNGSQMGFAGLHWATQTGSQHISFLISLCNLLRLVNKDYYVRQYRRNSYRTLYWMAVFSS